MPIRPKKVEQVFSTVDVVAAAVAIHREDNAGDAIKHDFPAYQNGTVAAHCSNVTFVKNILTKTPEKITEDDREKARKIIQHLCGTMTMNILMDRVVSGFMKAMTEALNSETTTESKFSVIVYAPSYYDRYKKREEKDEKVLNASITSVGLGTPGDKVKINLEVISSDYVQSISCFSVIGTDGKGNLVQFLTNKEELCCSQPIEAKIKSNGLNEYMHNAIVTVLNYVKAAKK